MTPSLVRVTAVPLHRVKGRGLLEHLVRKASVTDADVAALLSQLLDALAYLHAHTLCHLDCRVGIALSCSSPLVPHSQHTQPANILVQASRHVEAVKLIDFGAARHFGCNRQMLPLEHSYENPAGYHFLAPEAFKQLPLSSAADMW